MSSRRSTNSDDVADDEEAFLGGVGPDGVRDLLPTAEEFGHGILEDE
jgi:hypothetical protein